MSRLCKIVGVAAWFALGPVVYLGSGAATTGSLSLQEVCEVLRTNLPGLDPAELEHASVESLLQRFGGRVELVPSETQSEEAQSGSGLARTNLFDNSVGYFRVAQVVAGLPADLTAALETLRRTNELRGLIIDLRFACGEDYKAAAAVADLFLGTARPLLDWGSGLVHSTPKTNAITLPVVVLVNRQTSGAAEALAALMREVGVGVIIGTNTAGRVFVMEEIPLTSGHRLRIGKAGVKLADGQQLPEDGVKPDVTVAVAPQQEREFLEDPYKQLSQPAVSNRLGEFSGSNGEPGQTNRVPRRRINEAELIREHMQGSRLGTPKLARTPGEAETPIVTDPVLARGIDLIKGLALLREAQGR